LLEFVVVAAGGCASTWSGILGPELNGGEYGVEWLRHAVEVDRVDE
jgi:hypothetical protein